MYKNPIDFNTEDLESLKTTELKRLADYWLRQYLLKNAERNGKNQIFCPLKKKWYLEDKINCCHYIDRSIMSTRFDLDNVHLISSSSNMWDSKELVEGYKSKHHKEFSEYLGEKKIEEILLRSKKLTIFAKQDYINLIKKFKDE